MLRYHTPLRFSAALACVVSSTVGWAQAAPSSSAPAANSDAAQPGEILVTAQKRTQNIQRVGVAVSALGVDSLASIGRQDVTALAGQLPSVQVNQYSPTITSFNIRGVSQNDFADSQEAPIAFYNDEVYVSALGAISGMTYDLERIEVLRGPQGTLFGRNATGGLVQIISAKPTRSTEGFITATVGSYGQFATEGALSGPITDRLRARLSFTTNNGGDYIENRAGPDLGGAKFYAGRLQLAGEVGANGEFTFKVQGLGNDHDRQAGLYSHVAVYPNALGLGRVIGPNENPWGTCNGCDAFGYKETDTNPFTVGFDGPNYFSRRYWSATLHYTQDLGGATLTSVTDYQNLWKRYGEDDDMSPANIFQYRTAQNLYQISQELRLSGDTGRLNWLVGAYGIKINTRNGYDADLTGAFGVHELYNTVLNTESIAGFGQLEYTMTDQLSIIGGLRYSQDWKRYDYNHSENGILDFVFDPMTFPDLAKKKFGNYSGKAEVDYKPNVDTLVYLSINRGTKSGGFGTPAFGPFEPETIPFKQEVLTNYEGGFKLTLLDRTTHFNVSVFHYDYHNYQSFEQVSIIQTIRNKNALLTGVEAEVNTRPTEGLYLQAFGTFLHTKVKHVTLPSGDVLDRSLPQAPRWSVGGLARYEINAGPGKLAVQTDWKYDDVQYFSTFNSPIDKEPARIVGNARLSYAFGKLPLEAAVFVNNLTDRQYRVYELDLSQSFGFAQQTYARPRWFGGSVTYRIK